MYLDSVPLLHCGVCCFALDSGYRGTARLVLVPQVQGTATPRSLGTATPRSAVRCGRVSAPYCLYIQYTDSSRSSARKGKYSIKLQP
jgi:hypothetical protein